MKRIKIKQGQIFALPLAPQAFAFGQILCLGGVAHYMAGFDLICESLEEFAADRFESSKVLFLGNFFDNLIKKHRWPLVSESSVRTLPLPFYRVLIEGNWTIETWDRTRQTVLPAPAAANYPFRQEHGAIFLETALQCHFGFRTPDAYEEKYLPSISASFITEIAALNPFDEARDSCSDVPYTPLSLTEMGPWTKSVAGGIIEQP